MFHTKLIPQYDDDAANWPRFLGKAAKGSCKACDILQSADIAYMVTITHDATAPEMLQLQEYDRLFRDSFPKTRPFSAVWEVAEMGSRRGWFPHRFAAAQRPRHGLSHYQALWKRGSPVEEPTLIHDAIHLVHKSWSPDHCRACIGEPSLDYNSLLVVAGMIYFSLIWPEDTPAT